jgi:hypothetical protein
MIRASAGKNAVYNALQDALREEELHAAGQTYGHLPCRHPGAADTAGVPCLRVREKKNRGNPPGLITLLNCPGSRGDTAPGSKAL